MGSRMVKKSNFAKNHGNKNQPGCYYDQGHGVLFNTNKAWSGKFNEADDRPICKKNAFRHPSGLYSLGIKKKRGSRECPRGYVQVQNEKECKEVTEGRCLSTNAAECEVWVKWLNTNTFAKNHGTGNQYGCYYDKNDGVLFNTNKAFSGKFNEFDDRPICKSLYAVGIKKKGGSRQCPSGYAPLDSLDECKKVAAGRCLSRNKAECKLWRQNVRDLAKNWKNNQPGCKYDQGNGVVFNKNKNWNGKFNEDDDRPICKKNAVRHPSGLYSLGIKKKRGSRECPRGYVQVQNEKECKEVAEGRCLSTNAAECEVWVKWLNSNIFAKNHGTGNQYGCYYDKNDGVLFNTNKAFSGKFNEGDDRPICKSLYAVGIKKKGGSRQCPNGYAPLDSVDECKRVAAGGCLSLDKAECKLWSGNVKDLAKNWKNNQPGCKYDQGNGVVFNKNKNWNGKFNEDDDRPICKRARRRSFLNTTAETGDLSPL